jgi:hypothetical protein
MTGDQQNQQQEYSKQNGSGGGNPFGDMFGGGQGRQAGNGRNQGNYCFIENIFLICLIFN